MIKTVLKLSDVLKDSNKLIEFHKRLIERDKESDLAKYDWYWDIIGAIEKGNYRQFITELLSNLAELMKFGIICYKPNENGTISISDEEFQILNKIDSVYDKLLNDFLNNEEYKNEFDMGCGPI